MAFDPIGVLRALAEGGVRHVMIGGMAATVHGSPTVTGDLDICPERSGANLDRLAAVLGDADSGDVTVVEVPLGTAGYHDLRAGAVEVDLDGLVVPVASIDDLMRMKRAADRPKDRIELEILGALRDEIDGGWAP